METCRKSLYQKTSAEEKPDVTSPAQRYSLPPLGLVEQTEPMRQDQHDGLHTEGPQLPLELPPEPRTKGDGGASEMG